MHGKRQRSFTGALITQIGFMPGVNSVRLNEIESGGKSIQRRLDSRLVSGGGGNERRTLWPVERLPGHGGRRILTRQLDIVRSGSQNILTIIKPTIRLIIRRFVKKCFSLTERNVNVVKKPGSHFLHWIILGGMDVPTVELLAHRMLRFTETYEGVGGRRTIIESCA